jgi:hypothetical protein
MMADLPQILSGWYRSEANRMLSYPEFAAVSFATPPNWRFVRAECIASRSCRSYRDDQATLECAKFLRISRSPSASASKKHRDFVANHPLRKVLALHQDPRFSHLQLDTKARILAGQEPAAIAEQTGLPPELISLFESIFFDIRHRIECVPYISGHVLHENADSIFNPSPEELILHHAYFFGWGAARTLLSTFRSKGGELLRKTLEGQDGAINSRLSEGETKVANTIKAFLEIDSPCAPQEAGQPSQNADTLLPQIQVA